MKAKEIRELSAEEIRARIKEEEDQLNQLNFQHAIAELPNPMLLRQKRRLIARLKTILNEKEKAEAAA
ncbi:50S ribosomal protein L29 [Rhodocaloribacter litoris]|uniref:50S ribosomal protein L29 n=1 Tax=Rhodocaloribacter litoris TaxID=2558931 RepID=UPI0014212B5F|nr:50S ribosomal protein L29 [Rhodocaloribacter litoris]QXD16723.1 50S ribosomal protein L29 [Rhodocaloribacter litoris]